MRGRAQTPQGSNSTERVLPRRHGVVVKSREKWWYFPRNWTCLEKRDHFKRQFSSFKYWFSGEMLVFGIGISFLNSGSFGKMQILGRMSCHDCLQQKPDPYHFLSTWWLQNHKSRTIESVEFDSIYSRTVTVSIVSRPTKSGTKDNRQERKLFGWFVFWLHFLQCWRIQNQCSVVFEHRG